MKKMKNNDNFFQKSLSKAYLRILNMILLLPKSAQICVLICVHLSL